MFFGGFKSFMSLLPRRAAIRVAIPPWIATRRPLRSRRIRRYGVKWGSTFLPIVPKRNPE
jgi:hypothetical protein